MRRPLGRGGRVARPRQAGIGLIEAIVAMAILAFAVVGLSYLTIGTLENGRHGRRLSAAARLAQDKIEEVRGLDYAAVVAGGDGPLTETGAAGGTGAIYSRTWSVVEGVPVAGTKRVSVAIGWRSKDGDRDVVIATLVAE